ncbi:hypothetical protein ACLPJK_26020 [Pseudomonas aeruginosa]|uniref:hypothetical protein n=1 Tax=Pseudomonas aeruginosa TaxID=287 RepID=UPI003D2E2325
MRPLRDTEWIKQSFLLDSSQIDDAGFFRRTYSKAASKFVDTSLGGHWALNPLPQFCKYTDPPVKGRFNPSEGMGEWYSDVIDDNAQLIHIRAGLPKFNSLTRFFGNFYSAEANALAKGGRISRALFKFGAVLGSLVTIPLQPLVLVGATMDYFFNRPSTSYYTLSSRMALYWSACNAMVNGVAVGLGFIGRQFTDPYSVKQGASQFVAGLDRKDDVKEFSDMLGKDILFDNGTINLTGIVGKPQRLADQFYDRLNNILGSNRDSASLRQALLQMSTVETLSDDPGNVATLTSYLNEYMTGNPEAEYDPNKLDNVEELDNSEESLNNWSNYFKAEARMGLEFVTFRVDHTGTQTESFSNVMKESAIATTINSISGEAREKRFSVADGNITGFVGAAIEGAMSVVNGIASQFQVDGVAALAGSAMVDIPKIYDTSSADINVTTFNIPLRSPYGHDLSRLQHLIIPLCCLLGLTLPISTGPQSYTQPFMLELFNRGRTRIQRGMVTSLTVTRGVGDVGWTNDGKYLGIDVSISIADMSSVMHMPIIASYSFLEGAAMATGAAIGAVNTGIANAVGVTDTSVEDGARQGAAMAALLNKSTYAEDGLHSTYLNLLASIPFEVDVNPSRKLRLRATQRVAQWEQKLSKAHISNWFMDGLTGDAIRAIHLATNRGD